MAVRTIAELPFRERPVLELLHLDEPRDAPDPDYAGYGWARVDRIWLVTERARSTRGPGPRAPYARECPEGATDAGAREVRDPVVLALHSADDGEPLAADVELELELAGQASVGVLASAFLARWLPRLPRAPAIVLAMCNPFDARLAVAAPAPLHHALGDVESWLAPDGRILLAARTWCTL